MVVFFRGYFQVNCDDAIVHAVVRRRKAQQKRTSIGAQNWFDILQILFTFFYDHGALEVGEHAFPRRRHHVPAGDDSRVG